MTSQRIIQTISASSPADEKSDISDIWKIPPEEISSGVYENNRLHHAIINNNTDLAIKIIAMDAEGKNSKDKSKINDVSGFNTPLLLALKTGNMKIVNALLEHPCINVSIDSPDMHGFMPLHWACMLRQNDVINKLILLHKNSESGLELPTIGTWWERFSKELPRLSPFFLYINDLPISNMKPSGFKDTQELKMGTFYGNKSLEEKVLAYTDIVFHMSSLCTNLGWGDNLKFKSLDSTILVTSELFCFNFFHGIDAFIKNHNQIQVDLKIAEQLAVTRDEKNELGKLREKFATVTPSENKPKSPG